ncbi:uncharacterized protein LOC111629111 [Centruroides sculpturatus]|uniref:uncharacterized protein LOC111629111 n=1 Tax=Centruroides sculpturatus TaxID=218467 RepID=UPI000C6CA916|nr:uncharacterized protein LOC111629111 [Centruroides sculpturatus]
MNKVQLEIVQEIKFLGIILTPTITFEKQYKKVVHKSNCLINNMMKLCTHIKLKNIFSHFRLFTSIIFNAISYASPIWSLTNYKKLESIQNKFIRKLFTLEYNIAGYALRIELSRFRLAPFFIKRFVNFLYKIRDNNNLSTKLLYLLYKKMCQKPQKNTWISQMKNIINEYGVSISPILENSEISDLIRKQLIHNALEISLAQDIEEIHKRREPKWYKILLNYPFNNNYILSNMSFTVKKFFIQLRLNSNMILINNRIYEISKSNCPRCQELFTKYHVFCECKTGYDLRIKMDLKQLNFITEENQMYCFFQGANIAMIYKLYNYIKTFCNQS